MPNSSVLVERGGAKAHHFAQKVLLKQLFKRTLVQSSRMLYNVPYFVDFIKGFADELIEDASKARSPPKRERPTGSQPLVNLGKYSIVALVGAARKAITSERYTSIRTDDSINLCKCPEISGLLPRKTQGLLKTTLLYDGLPDRFYHTQSKLPPTF